MISPLALLTGITSRIFSKGRSITVLKSGCERRGIPTSLSAASDPGILFQPSDQRGRFPEDLRDIHPSGKRIDDLL